MNWWGETPGGGTRDDHFVGVSVLELVGLAPEAGEIKNVNPNQIGEQWQKWEKNGNHVQRKKE